MNDDEAYYWSSIWQQDVMESMRALREGAFKDFDSDEPSQSLTPSGV